MEAGFVSLAVITLIVGVVAGMLVERYVSKRREIKGTQGILNVVYDEYASEPGLFLALTVPIAEVASHKTATFSVNILRDNSHE